MSQTLHKANFFGPVDAWQSVHFKETLQVDGALSGLTITDIYNQLGTQLGLIGGNTSSIATEKSRAETEEAALSGRIDTVVSDLASLQASASSDLDSAINTLNASIDAERGARQVADEKMVQTTNNAISALNSRCNDLITLHNTDSARLTTIETALAQRDEEVDAKIESQIAEHNADIADLDPRVKKIEQLFTVNPTERSITFLQGWKVVVPGEFETGLQNGAVATYDQNPAAMGSAIDPGQSTLTDAVLSDPGTVNNFPPVDPVSSS